MDEQIYKVVKNEENHDSLRINAVFRTEGVQLTVLQGSSALDAKVTFPNRVYVCFYKQFTFQIENKALQNLSEGLNKSLDEYCAELKEYISTVPENVKFSLKGTEFTIYYVAGSSIKIKFFSCTLYKVYCNLKSIEHLIYNEFVGKLLRFRRMSNGPILPRKTRMVLQLPKNTQREGRN